MTCFSVQVNSLIDGTMQSATWIRVVNVNGGIIYDDKV